MRWPAFIDRGGRGFYVGRDLRGHFTTPETIEEPCQHACCKGAARPVTIKHPAGAKISRAKKARARRVPTRDGWGSWTAREAPKGEAKKARDRGRGRYDFDSYLSSHYHDAEKVTRGYMVTKAAKARGITGADFFKPGRRPSVEKWGSDELKEWFRRGDTGTRSILTASEFAAQRKAAA